MKPLRLACLLFLTACAPAVIPTTERAPVIPSATPQTLAFGDYLTYYETLGQGEPVVLVHGIGGGSSIFQYRKNAAALTRAGFKVYALDLLGFGRSSRPDIRYTQDLLTEQLTEFLEQLPEPAAVVANGLSAAYAIRIAAEHPELVSKLVLISPTGYERLSRPQNEARIAGFNRFRGILGGVLNAALLDPGTQRFFLLDAYAGRQSLTPEVLENYDSNLQAENARWVIFSFISGNLDQDVSQLWPEVQQPVLMLWGDEATTTPIGDAQDFMGARPQTTLLPVRDTKLLPNEDRPGVFNRVVRSFLARRARIAEMSKAALHPSTRVSSFGETVFATYTRLAERYGAVNLGQGFPDFAPPEFALDALRDAASGPQQYAPLPGLPVLLDAVAKKMSVSLGRTVSAPENVQITVGATEALFAAMQAFISPGDEVVVLEPFYDAYPADVVMAGRRPQIRRFGAARWRLGAGF